MIVRSSIDFWVSSAITFWNHASSVARELLVSYEHVGQCGAGSRALAAMFYIAGMTMSRVHQTNGAHAVAARTSSIVCPRRD